MVYFFCLTTNLLRVIITMIKNIGGYLWKKLRQNCGTIAILDL